MRNIKTLFITIALVGFISCSDNSTGSEEMEAGTGTGEISVTGAQEAHYTGVAWYVGLRSGDGFRNLTLSLSEYLPTESGESLYTLSVTFLGTDEEPFILDTTTYDNGEASENMLISATYGITLENGERAVYSTGPNSTGTITVLSITDTSIKVAVDVTIEAGQFMEEGQVSVTGEINAVCLTAESGFGC